MPNLRIFVEDIVTLLVAMTDIWMKKKKRVCGRHQKLSNDQVKFAFCISLNCILVVLSDTNIIWLEIIFSNVIKSKEF